MDPTEPIFTQRAFVEKNLGLGTGVIDATDRNGEGTVVDLAGGLWVAPFVDEGFLSRSASGWDGSGPCRDVWTAS